MHKSGTSLMRTERAVERFANRDRNNALGRQATQQMKAAQAFDAVAFDAAGSSGMAFLASQLELIDPDLVKPLQETTHQRDIDIEFGGGYPEFISIFASSYGSAGTQGYGLQGTNNTEIPMVNVDTQKQTIPVFPWAGGFTLTWLDLKRMAFAAQSGQPAPVSLQSLYDDGISTTWVKMLDGLTYQGFQGQYGLVNNPNSPSFVVPNGTWATKSPTQILADINFALNQTISNSGYAMRDGCANTLLVPLSPQFAVLTQPMSIGGVGYDSLISYIKRNCIATQLGVPFDIKPLPNPWITGQGVGGLDRAVMYRKDKKSLYLKIPAVAEKGMTTPSTRIGGAYDTLYFGAVAPPIFKRTTTMIYMDGV